MMKVWACWLKDAVGGEFIWPQRAIQNGRLDLHRRSSFWPTNNLVEDLFLLIGSKEPQASFQVLPQNGV